MKIIITESKINDAILKYIVGRATPDYGWGPQLHDFYRKDVDIYGSYTFIVNDHEAYTYLGSYDGYDYLYTLEMSTWLYDELTSLFRDKWYPVFKKWFEENTGLEIREFGKMDWED